MGITHSVINSSNTLNQMIRAKTNICKGCEKPLVISDLITSKISHGRTSYTYNFHKRCYDNWGY